MNEKITRRTTLRLVVIGTAALGVTSVVGCGDESAACDDTEGLTTANRQTRQAMRYVSHSTQPDKKCNNCSLFTAGQAPSGCGSCTVVPGPIHPDGYCSAWVAQS